VFLNWRFRMGWQERYPLSWYSLQCTRLVLILRILYKEWKLQIPVMIIDSHTHTFSPDTRIYPLANPNSTYRPQTDGSAALLRAQMAAAGVDRAFTITAGFYGWDNQSVIDALPGNSEWLAAGVLIDPASPEAPDLLESSAKKGASGLRIQRHLFYHHALDDPISTPLWSKAAEMDLTVDINATQEEFGAVENRVRQFPRLRVVLDHCGYVSAALKPIQNTVEPVLLLARYPNVYVKLTFLPTASEEPYPFRDVHWMVREIVNDFGAHRCLFGSNFPTAQYSPRTSYAQTVELFQEVIDLAPEERSWILGGTASQLWKWSSGVYGQTRGVPV
jgi:L-fuconolactonase